MSLIFMVFQFAEFVSFGGFGDGVDMFYGSDKRMYVHPGSSWNLGLL
jgi:hypothetical protein